MLQQNKIKKSTVSLPVTEPQNSFTDLFIQIALFIHLVQIVNIKLEI